MTSKVDARLLRTTKFPLEFNQKVDMTKVNLPVMKKWIATRISEIIQNEDDVLVELCYNLIEDSRHPDIKAIQIQLTGFLEKDTPQFCKELWNLLLSGQNSSSGVPKELLEAKKLELMQEKKEADRANARRSDDVSDLKERDRRDSRSQRDAWYGSGRRGDRSFGNRGRGGSYGRTGQRSPSPEPRGRGSRDAYGGDSYVPEPRRGRDVARRRERSLSTEESSRSRTRRRSTPQRRGISPGRPDYSRKRSRSPYGDDRHDRRNHDIRDRRGNFRRSVSISSRRFSPAPKRRRSESRGASVERSRPYNGSASCSKSRATYRHRSRDRSRGSSRSRSASLSRSRSRSRSRGRSRSRSRSRSRGHSRKRNSYQSFAPRDRRYEPTLKRRQYRHYSSSPDPDSTADEYGYSRGRRKRAPRRGRTESFRGGREDSTGRRRNSSSECSYTSDRVKTADVLEDKTSSTPQKPIASIEKNEEEAKQALRKENLLKEKLLRERIIKMRPSSRSGAPAGSQG